MRKEVNWEIGEEEWKDHFKKLLDESKSRTEIERGQVRERV